MIDKHEKTVLVLQNETLVELLNDFYRIHFFELADTYTVKRQVILQDRNKIATVIRKMVDMSSQRLCIGIAEYGKCVTIMDGQPQEASQLVKRLRHCLAKAILNNSYTALFKSDAFCFDIYASDMQGSSIHT